MSNTFQLLSNVLRAQPLRVALTRFCSHAKPPRRRSCGSGSFCFRYRTQMHTRSLASHRLFSAVIFSTRLKSKIGVDAKTFPLLRTIPIWLVDHGFSIHFVAVHWPFEEFKYIFITDMGKPCLCDIHFQESVSARKIKEDLELEGVEYGMSWYCRDSTLTSSHSHTPPRKKAIFGDSHGFLAWTKLFVTCLYRVKMPKKG
jgi:hypothetical protein